jgi:long-chain acyl-CoA synthetase
VRSYLNLLSKRKRLIISDVRCLSALFTSRPWEGYQGYGLTESYAVPTSQGTSYLSSGNCALPVEACLILEISYILDVNCSSAVTRYSGDDDDNGWFCTGDICVIDEMGRFKIIDRRKKKVLKLAQGEYISPERLEGIILSEHSYLAQAYVHGDSLQTSLIATFGIQLDTFALFASILGSRQRTGLIP